MILLPICLNLTFANVQPIFVSRCSQCHARMRNLNWEDERNVVAHKTQLILQLENKLMPPGNMTNMTPTERETVLQYVRGL